MFLFDPDCFTRLINPYFEVFHNFFLNVKEIGLGYFYQGCMNETRLVPVFNGNEKSRRGASFNERRDRPEAS